MATPIKSRSVVADLLKAGKISPATPLVPWTPKFPEASSAGPAGRDVDVGFEAVGEWTAAPAASHLIGFRAWVTSGRSPELWGGFKGFLYVRFKGTTAKSGKSHPDTEYRYSFRDSSDCKRVFEMLKAADHPGHVVDAELIAPRIPYERTAVGTGNDAKQVQQGA